MRKALIVTSVASMIQQFNMINISLLQNMGYTVEVACNFEDGNTISKKKILELKRDLQNLEVKFYQVDFSRSITNVSGHVKSYKQLQKIVDGTDYSFIHCQSPIAGLITRMIKYPASRIIYTAHGFHFYKGAPLKNWLLFYPLEKIFSRRTNDLITINNEDFNFAQKKFHAKRISYVHGVGLSTSKFDTVKVADLTNFKNFDDDLVFLSIGELNDNKNHEQVINELGKIKDNHFIYLICGVGNKEGYLKQVITNNNLNKQVFLLGYRDDIPALLSAADVYIHPSKREGLPVSVMEAMYVGLPICCSNIRGNTDLVKNNVNGYLVDLSSSIKGFSYYLSKFLKNSELSRKMGESSNKLIQSFLENNVVKELRKIYEHY